MRRTLALFAVAAGALVTAGPAGAETWTVWADTASNPPKAIPKSTFFNQYFPSALQVRAGDRVTFRSRAFHTATFLAATTPSQVPLLIPAPGQTYSGITDALGASFYFNGLPKLIYNAQGVYPAGAPVVADRKLHNSGILLFAGKKGYTFRFPKAGTYKFVCIVHPGMEGRIVVRPKAAAARTKTAVTAAVAKQLTRAFATAQSQIRIRPSTPNTVIAGVGTKVAALNFLPETLTVPLGTKVTWINRSPSEVHNVAFGPKPFLQTFLRSTDLLGPPGSPLQLSPVFVYGSDPTPYIYDGANHGNGFLSTPLTDVQPGDPPQGLPQSVEVIFSKAGSYRYYCLIHIAEGMEGEIVVTG
jgi:plastocyanin